MVAAVPVLSGSRIASVMLFADDTRAVAMWWAGAFGAERVNVEEHAQGPFVFFETGDIEFGVHVADPDKNPVGGSPVVYWSVDSVGSARAALLERGATHHRGPIEVDHERSICQLRDPYGNVFGLDGPP
jgi:predicted enzyme related to lactoylglutathione lyase